MNHTCVIECLLEQSRKVGILKCSDDMDGDSGDSNNGGAVDDGDGVSTNGVDDANYVNGESIVLCC